MKIFSSFPIVIDRDVLLRDGSAVDSAIAGMLCIGVVVPHSSGLGGGFFMSIYEKDNRQAITLNAREKAPAGVSPNMYNDQRNLSAYGKINYSVSKLQIVAS